GPTYVHLRAVLPITGAGCASLPEETPALSGRPPRAPQASLPDGLQSMSVCNGRRQRRTWYVPARLKYPAPADRIRPAHGNLWIIACRQSAANRPGNGLPAVDLHASQNTAMPWGALSPLRRSLLWGR